MRQEDKEVDGPELEHAEERKRETELVEEKDDEVYDLDGKYESQDKEHTKHSGVVLEAMKKIMKGEQIVINDLDMDKRHLEALEAVKMAVDGKDKNLGTFVYAEDRRTLLEQALAVLQPDLMAIAELGKPFEELLKEVGELREKLNVLEDSEEELVEGRVKDAVIDESDSDDKDDDDDDDKSLTGPERDIKKPKSSLGGEARKEEPKPATTLTGPERKEEPKPATTLGDPKEIEKAAERNANNG